MCLNQHIAKKKYDKICDMKIVIKNKKYVKICAVNVVKNKKHDKDL